MKRDSGPDSTQVTSVVQKPTSESRPTMSYTTIMERREMAAAFTRELLRLSREIVPDHPLSLDDLISICQTASAGDEEETQILSGRNLRARIHEQVGRAVRYKEPFSIISLKIDDITDAPSYEAFVDTLRERLRGTDLLFLFKKKVILLLPHTDHDACQALIFRVFDLLENAFDEPHKTIGVNSVTFPSESYRKGSQVLDWAEDQLR